VSTVVLILRLALAAVFLAAALGKLARPAATAGTLADFGLPRPLRRPGAYALPAVELATAALLVPEATARSGAGLALVLLVGFSAAVARLLARGERPACNCFGAVASTPVGPRTLVRNGGLAAAAAVVLAAGPGAALASIGDADTATVAIAAAGVALLAALAGFALSWQLMRQNGRLLGRLDALEERVRKDDGIVAGPGEPMPAFELPDMSGDPVSLADLLEDDRGVLLLFTDPECQACNPLLPEIGRRQRDPLADPRPVVISLSDAAAAEPKVAEHGLEQVLLQETFDLPRSVGLKGMPGAIELDRRGRIVGTPTLGGDAVGALLRELGGAGGGEAGADAGLEVVKVGGDRW
jgi:hypothetical protein